MSSMSLNMMSFSPRQLFNGGEQGAWYDPSDMSTMFQNSAGTTPVTAVEQPVGLILDKSKGLALGAEIAVNGSFASGTGWSTQTGWAISSGTANATAATGYLYQGNASVVLNRYYEVTFTVSNYVSGSVRAYLGSNPTLGTAISANGTYTQRFSPTLSGAELGLYGSAFTGSIDNVSVKEVFGNHASQATAASRPVLSARVNLLTYSEQFDNDAVWNKLNSGTGVLPVVTANYAVAPNGSQTADRIQFDLGATPTTALSRLFQGGLPVITSCVNSIYLKTNDGTTKTLYFGRSDGNTFDSITVTSEWQQFVAPASGSNNGQMQFGLSGASSGVPVTTSTIADILAWGADLRVTNDGVGIPAYQRVAAATDYDTSSFPVYLKFDGTDDSLSTASIDFSATDKMSVFAGVRRTAVTANYQCITETSATTDTNNGVVSLFSEPAGAVARIYYQSRGTTALQAYAAPGVFPDVTTNVLTGQSNISAPSLSLRSNGVSVASTTSSQGTGNYGNYPLYIGRRGGSLMPFNGRLYSLIVRGATSTTGQITDTEGWINGRTRAY